MRRGCAGGGAVESVRRSPPAAHPVHESGLVGGSVSCSHSTVDRGTVEALCNVCAVRCIANQDLGNQRATHCSTQTIRNTVNNRARSCAP